MTVERYYFIFELKQGLDRLQLYRDRILKERHYAFFLESMNMIIREDVPSSPELIRAATKYRDRVWVMVREHRYTIDNPLLTDLVISVIERTMIVIQERLGPK